MLGRYTIYRGKRPPHDALPRGVRQDTRKHTSHCLRPAAEMVEKFLADPAAVSWDEFRTDYLALLESRFAADSGPFDTLAERARREDVFLGCSCPTRKNPDVRHCHTFAALQFMQQRYPDLHVVLPGE